MCTASLHTAGAKAQLRSVPQDVTSCLHIAVCFQDSWNGSHGRSTEEKSGRARQLGSQPHFPGVPSPVGLERTHDIVRIPPCWYGQPIYRDLAMQVDGVLHQATQEAVYTSVAAPLVDNTLQGFNSTLLCYGQTGAGKTHTVCGDAADFSSRGVIPRAIATMFAEADAAADRNIAVSVSCLEVYNEQLYDLLAADPRTAGNVRCQEDAAGGISVQVMHLLPLCHCGRCSEPECRFICCILLFCAALLYTGARALPLCHSVSHDM